MPHEIRVPRLGWSMEEGTFVGWRKQPGEAVAVGEILFELEGEKALQEIESVDEGILSIPADAPAPGSVVPVGQLLGYLLQPGEAPPSESGPPVEAAVVAQPVLAGPAVAPTSPRIVASPRARRIAGELGVDWKTLKGSGQGGRIRESDVRAAARPEHPNTAATRLSPRRRAIAEHLRSSRDRNVAVTITTVADATNLVALREQFKGTGATVVPAITDLMACLAARVLGSHPDLAMRWDEGRQGLVPPGPDGLGIGIAVHTPAGLLVPVVKDVSRKPLPALAEESRGLIERARAGRLPAEAMQGGVFTITNLGAYGIDAFTPIINDPEVAILGLGAIRREPVSLPDDRVVTRERMVMSLTFDHAAVDGAPAAAFLQELANAVAHAAAHLILR